MPESTPWRCSPGHCLRGRVRLGPWLRLAPGAPDRGSPGPPGSRIAAPVAGSRSIGSDRFYCSRRP